MNKITNLMLFIFLLVSFASAAAKDKALELNNLHLETTKNLLSINENSKKINNIEENTLNSMFSSTNKEQKQTGVTVTAYQKKETNAK